MTCHLCHTPVIDGNNILESHCKYELKRNGAKELAVCNGCNGDWMKTEERKKYYLTDIINKP